jgi:hypothetical protein
MEYLNFTIGAVVAVVVGLLTLLYSAWPSRRGNRASMQAPAPWEALLSSVRKELRVPDAQLIPEGSLEGKRIPSRIRFVKKLRDTEFAFLLLAVRDEGDLYNNVRLASVETLTAEVLLGHSDISGENTILHGIIERSKHQTYLIICLEDESQIALWRQLLQREGSSVIGPRRCVRQFYYMRSLRELLHIQEKLRIAADGADSRTLALRIKFDDEYLRIDHDLKVSGCGPPSTRPCVDREGTKTIVDLLNDARVLLNAGSDMFRLGIDVSRMEECCLLAAAKEAKAVSCTFQCCQMMGQSTLTRPPFNWRGRSLHEGWRLDFDHNTFCRRPICSAAEFLRRSFEEAEKYCGAEAGLAGKLQSIFDFGLLEQNEVLIVCVGCAGGGLLQFLPQQHHELVGSETPVTVLLVDPDIFMGDAWEAEKCWTFVNIKFVAMDVRASRSQDENPEVSRELQRIRTSCFQVFWHPFFDEDYSESFMTSPACPSWAADFMSAIPPCVRSIGGGYR